VSTFDQETDDFSDGKGHLVAREIKEVADNGIFRTMDRVLFIDCATLPTWRSVSISVYELEQPRLPVLSFRCPCTPQVGEQ